jgi:hypothetical protein
MVTTDLLFWRVMAIRSTMGMRLGLIREQGKDHGPEGVQVCSCFVLCCSGNYPCRFPSCSTGWNEIFTEFLPCDCNSFCLVQVPDSE